ncbi:MAG: MotA/TolQ/ExbB proton channel family protein, partial [Desulfobacterium sp.]|nr:MotA/TolQ/ExbB proton channel family protein [Desulfobacterium sp.]MBU4054818.1 MotA/TolQ/ExbB proton channel family protein [Pseudomonadota bacterium]
MLDFLAKGGILVIPILLCSVLALAIFVERVIRFAKMKARGAGLAQKTIDFMKEGKIQEIDQLLTESNSPMGR